MNVGDTVEFVGAHRRPGVKYERRVGIIVGNSYTAGSGDHYPDVRMVLWSTPFFDGRHHPVPIETQYLQVLNKNILSEI